MGRHPYSAPGQQERVVGFEEALNREGSRGGRNVEGSRPSEIETRENGNRGVNLPLLLAAHLGRNESGQPLQSSLTSVHGGHQPLTNIGGIFLLTDYDEEREMKPRPDPNREATPTLQLRYLVVHRQRERVVRFEEAPNREGSKRGRNAEGSRPSEIETRENGNRGVNLPPFLATYLGRNESGQPLQSSLISIHGGHQSLTNIGGNLPPNGTLLSHHAQPFIPSSLHTPTGLVHIYVNPYS
ncbi:hypothetical protein Tco_0226728 [Tanacetum coccineum]